MAGVMLFSSCDMTKTYEAISEAVRDAKHVFAKTQNHSKKTSRHRYERRKAREYLALTDWLVEEPA